MNVGQLRLALEGVPDEVQVVVPTRDHSYTEADAEPQTALTKDEFLPEYTQDPCPGEPVSAEYVIHYGSRVDVFLVHAAGG